MACEKEFVETTESELGLRSRPLADDLAEGRVVVVRDVAALRHFRAELIATASERASSNIASELREFYDCGRMPAIESLHALVEAVKAARDERYLSECFAPIIRAMGFEMPVLVDGGISRLVLPETLIEKTRNFTGQFVETDYRRDTAGGPTETFMPGPSNIHRDFDRDHYLLMCNIWAPLHDAGEEEIVQIYPKLYYQPLYSMPNTPENRRVLGQPVRVSLRFGDFIVFHSENIHHSPDPARNKGRRHSYDFRIAAACPDDNRHYRDNFANLVNFRDARQQLPSLARYREPVAKLCEDHVRNGQRLSANYYWRSLERQPVTRDRLVQAHTLFRTYAFAEDRYLALARHAASIDAQLAADILEEVLRDTRLYYFALQCAENALEYGRPDIVRRACIKVLEIVQATGAVRCFAPIRYQAPTTQLLPDDARQRAEALLARAGPAEATPTGNCLPDRGVHRELIAKLRRVLSRIA